MSLRPDARSLASARPRKRDLCCEDCEHSFEALVRPGRSEDAACPQCRGAHLSGEMPVFGSARSGDGSIGGNGFTPSGGGCCVGGCH